MAAHFPPTPADYPTPSENHLPDTPFHAFAGSPSQRIAGWSAEKQVTFLQAIAEGLTVGQACRLVGLTQQSAYAFRHSARGTQFALGWQAALLKSRDTLADVLMERALHGIVETVTRPDGSEVERHRHDNRLAMAMLGRLDRLADKAAKETTHAAARLVAQEFDQYLDMIGQDGGPARAGLFLARRSRKRARTTWPRSARLPAPTSGCAPIPTLPGPSTISIPPRASAGAVPTGCAPRPPASSRSPPLLFPRPRPRTTTIKGIKISPKPKPATRSPASGGTGMRRRGAPASLRPRTSPARRMAIMATTAIRARSPSTRRNWSRRRG